MSYRFYSPRQNNFYPSGFPYFAGVSGLGDYASELAAYQNAQAAYLVRLQAYKEKCAAIDKDYGERRRSYNIQMASYNSQVAAIRESNVAKARAVDKAFGLSLPQSFYNGDACITAAQRDAYARSCQSNTVKGLGAVDSSCGMRQLPVCSFPVPPVAPVKPPYPAAPVEPKAPAAPVTPPSGGSGNGGGTSAPPSTSTPVTVPTSTPPAVTSDDSKGAGMVRNGIIVAVVLGGGYLVYRTIKKPKAA